MKKPKQKYNVYLVRDGDGCYEGHYEYFLGSTFAVSEAQACNNVRYRCGGGYSMWEVGDYAEEGSVLYRFKAELA